MSVIQGDVGGGGGTDATITFSDITTNDVSASKHGFMPKLPNTATKFWRDDGTYQPISGGGDALVANPLSQFATTTPNQLATVLTGGTTGTANFVRATSPTLVTPTLGAATATSVNKVTVTAPATASTLTIQDGFTLTVAGNATVSGASSGTNTGDQTNITGNAATVTTNANMTGDVTSVGNATTLAAGSASNLNSGTLAAGRMPALTGDITTSAGSIVTTLKNNPTLTGATLAGTLTGAGNAALGMGLLTSAVVARGNSGASMTIDWNSGAYQTVTLTANCTFTFTAPSDGKPSSLCLVLTQDGTGSRTVTTPATVVYGLGVAPTFSTTAAAADYLFLKYDGTNYVSVLIPSPAHSGGSVATLAISGGGTGQVTAGPALDALTVQGADIASAGTTNIAAATGRNVNVTGATTITAFGTAVAGVERVVRFTGILLLTHNGTSLILPTGANITTAADDTATCLSLGSGNWRVTSYARKSGAALTAAGGGGDLLSTNNLSDVANAGTARTNLGLAIGTNVQAFDADLSALAGLTSAADALPYFTGSGTAAVTTLTAAARTVLDDTTVANMLTTLGGLALAGGTMSGAIAMGNSNITGAKQVCFNGVVAAGNKTGATQNLADWTAGSLQTCTLTGNCTGTSTMTSPTGASRLTLIILQDGTGTRTISTWPATVKWVGGTVPTLSTAANAVDIFTFIWNGTSYFGMAGMGFA